MTSTSRKFDGVHAARLSLLITLGLTVGIGTAIYRPLDLKQSSTLQASQVVPSEPAPFTVEFGRVVASSTLDFSGDWAQSSGVGSATGTSLNSPQVVQNTQAPVLTTTRGS